MFGLTQQMLRVNPGPMLPDIYLEEVICGVVYQHDESSSTDVVHAPREADEQDGRYVVNNLLLEVLKKVVDSLVWCTVAVVAQACVCANPLGGVTERLCYVGGTRWAFLARFVPLWSAV